MSNLIRCRKCKNDFIREEYDDHVCSSGKFKGVRDIEVLQWWETTNEHGERIAFGLGSDGYNYRMREVKEGFIEIDPANLNLIDRKPTNLKQPDKTTNNGSIPKYLGIMQHRFLPLLHTFCVQDP